MTKRWTMAAALAAAGAAFAADIPAVSIAQLACPLRVTKVVAAYGLAGEKFKPQFYADANPDGKDLLWVAADFENGSEDVITGFTFEVRAWDATGTEVFNSDGIYDFAIRDKPGSKEWSWEVPGGEVVAKVIFIPRVINLPAGRTWVANEEFIAGKLADLKAGE